MLGTMVGKERTKNKVKGLLKYFGLPGLILLLVSCHSSVNLSDYVDKTAPFALTINRLGESAGLTKSDKVEIKVNSDKYKKLIAWIEKSSDNWSSSPASYITEVGISQDNFHLIYYHKGSVVLSFIDNDHEARQYVREIQAGELDFLLND
jgi:hypothetical protein